MANLTVWIAGILVVGVAGTAMALLGERRYLTARLALYCYTTGVPLVVAAYVAMLSIVVHLGPEATPEAVAVAKVVGWLGSRADWISTTLTIGVGPTLLALAGRGDWVPTWLFRWSFVTAAAGLLTALAMLTGGSGLTTYGFLVVPVGVGWMIAAGIVQLRYARAAVAPEVAA